MLNKTMKYLNFVIEEIIKIKYLSIINSKQKKAPTEPYNTMMKKYLCS